MENKDLLDDLSQYIEDLCKRHTLINHSDTEKHFVRLNSEELPQEKNIEIRYPVVTFDKVTVTYSGVADAERKSRSIELMFLDLVPDAGRYDHIESVLTNMEEIAEDFLWKMKLDRRNPEYPFLKSFTISGELDYVGNIGTILWGVLLSFDFDAPFNLCLAPNRFR